jgi:copper chaperone CopZ
MRRVIGILVASLALGALLLWTVERFSPVATAATAQEEAEGTVLNLSVPGMTCGSCEGRIRTALEQNPGVREVIVDLGSRTVRVTYDPSKADPKALAEAVTRAGYPARYLPEGTSAPAPRRSGSGCGGGCCDNKG